MLIQNLSKIDFQDKNLIDNILNLLIIHLLPLVIDDRETVTTDFLWCFLDVEGVRDRHRPGVFPFFLLVSSLFVEADRFYSSDLPFLLNRSPTMFRTGSKSGFSCARLSPSQSCATAVRASARRPPPLFPDREFPCSHRSSSRPRNRPCAGSRNDLQCRLTWLQGRRAVTVRCSFSGRKTLPRRPLHGSAGVFSWRSLRHSRSGFR